MKHEARIGSINTGTLKVDDLISAFGSELEYLAGASDLTREADAWLERDEDDRNQDEGDSILEELTDELNELAPAYCYFGSHEGDGADFGFWPIHGAIDELPRISDDAEDENGEPISFADQARALGEDCAFVNDHGNVTIYSGAGEIILELV